MQGSLVARPARSLPVAWEDPIGLIGLGMLVVGTWLGLWWAPPERFMGDVGRILYVHVPAAWIAMLCFALSGGFALGFLATGRRGWDSALEAATEVGVMFGTLLLVLGAVFAKPTWGVWWTWDARLSTTAVMVMSYFAVLLLRGIVRDPDRRATWSAISSVLASVNLPLTYLSVKWFRSIHAVASVTPTETTIDPTMRWILYFVTVALLFLTVWFLARRWRLAEARAERDVPDPLPA